MQRFIGLVRYLSNHQYSFLRTDQKPQTFLMQKSPAPAPKKLERPFVATSTVWVRDTLQAWEGYAISWHSAKSLHERPMNAMIFVLQGFLSLKLDNKPLNISAPERCTTKGILWTASFFDWFKLKMCGSDFRKFFFFKSEKYVFSSAKVTYWSIPSPMFT